MTDPISRSPARSRRQIGALIGGLTALVLLGSAGAARADGTRSIAPWAAPEVAIVLDLNSDTAIDLDALGSDSQVTGLIHRASEGLSAHDPDTYRARRTAAKQRGLLWGSSHLLTRSGPEAQIDLYLGQVGVHADELLAIEVSCLAGATSCPDPNLAVDADDIATAALRVKERAGRWPLLALNHVSMRALDRAFRARPEMAGLPLWYARYQSNITGVFPRRFWRGYALWQFNTEVNCPEDAHAAGRCAYVAPGADYTVDVNVFYGPVETLRRRWPAL